VAWVGGYIRQADMGRTILVNGVQEIVKATTATRGGRCHLSWPEAVAAFLDPPGGPAVQIHNIAGEAGCLKM
jgi:hypothetical protein